MCVRKSSGPNEPEIGASHLNEQKTPVTLTHGTEMMPIMLCSNKRKSWRENCLNPFRGSERRGPAQVFERMRFILPIISVTSLLFSGTIKHVLFVCE